MIHLLVSEQGSGILSKLRRSLQQDLDSSIISPTKPKEPKDVTNKPLEMGHKLVESHSVVPKTHNSSIKESAKPSNIPEPQTATYQDVNDSYISEKRALKSFSKDKTKKSMSFKSKSKRRNLPHAGTVKYGDSNVRVSLIISLLIGLGLHAIYTNIV